MGPFAKVPYRRRGRVAKTLDQTLLTALRRISGFTLNLELEFEAGDTGILTSLRATYH